MRHPLPALLLALIAAVAQAASLDTYCNARYTYCVGYPATLRPQGESDAGDGQVFLGADGHTELRVWGEWQLDGSDSLQARYRRARTATGVSYATLHADWFVTSGLDHGQIFYQKTVFDARGGRFATLLLHYPRADRSLTSLVAPLARSLRFGP